MSFVAVLAIYFTTDFKNEEDKQKLAQWSQMVNSQIKDPAAAATYITPATDLFNGLVADRKGLMKPFFYHSAHRMYGMIAFLSAG